MSRIVRTAKYLLSNIRHFSNLVLKVPLRAYQLEPLQHVIESVLFRQGLEFMVVMPRQSGKNEAVAQLLTYLLTLFQYTGGNLIHAAMGDALGMATDRLEDRLDNALSRGAWSKRIKPKRRCLGKCCCLFLSTHATAQARGQTAHHLLVLDETQDQLQSHIESVFTPMRAANNATALYIGTVKTTSDFLWTKKRELEAQQHADGIQRVFLIPPERVTTEVPAYRDFLDSQVARHGRHHPIIASEYFLEPIDAEGGLFHERRRRLMHGTHTRATSPAANRLYIAAIDVAGIDEAATDAVARLERPGRDYTVATIFEIQFPPAGIITPGPTYLAVDVFVDHGSSHFQDMPGRPALIHRLLAWLGTWNVAHVIADESGVGQGLVSWLQATMGEHRVTGYNFAPRNRKAALGSAFLSVVETGRFKYWTGDQAEPGSDGWWFWQQVAACAFELAPDGQFDKDLKWGVPPGHRTQTPTGPETTHDDRLLSAALIAQVDALYRAGQLTLGTATSDQIPGVDPLGGDVY